MNNEVTNYFSICRSSVYVDYTHVEEVVDQNCLREAQAGAYWAIRSYYTTRDGKTIVVMPTGSGKTAVMTLVALSLVEKRILIIVPSRVIREQIEREFNNLNIAKLTECIPNDLPLPNVHVVEHKLATIELWLDLEAYDVVISTPRCVSPLDQGVHDNPPLDLFDTIFVDEAHHLAARTWNGLINYFDPPKTISFTATPFRNDNKPIPGDIVYSYPLGRAIDRGIYRPIDFISVEGGGNEEIKDRRLAERAKEIWEEEKDLGVAKILVRVGRIKETERIKILYTNVGLNLEIVTSSQSLSDNEAAIQKATQNDDCHGLISVGMLGEGLDLPVLKIAVMHTPHQTFPVTLQFIGRICRTTENVEGNSKLIAIPEDVQEHTKGLYELDANWAELIPELTDAAIGIEQERREFSHERWDMSDDSRQVSLHTLRPSFAVCIYEIHGDINILAQPALKENIQLYQFYKSKDNNWRVLITKTYAKPLWSSTKSIQDVVYDLHIYYQTDDLLFEYTTSPSIASDVRNSIGGESLCLVPEKRVEQIISQSDLIAYYNIGLRRVTYSSSTIPTYKMLAGSHAEGTIRSSDGNFFSVGHLFGKVIWQDDELVIGFSSKKAKIWSSKRDHIKEFTEWCDVVAQIVNNEISRTLPFFEHLKHPSSIIELPAEPYCIVSHQKTFDHIVGGMRIELITEDRELVQSDLRDIPELRIQAWNAENPQQVKILFASTDFDITVFYDASEEMVFSWKSIAPYTKCFAKVKKKGRVRSYNIDEYLSEYPPTIYLSDGSAVVRKSHYPYQPRINQVPDEIMMFLDWDELDCEIRVEDFEMLQDHERREQLIAEEKVDVLTATTDSITALIENLLFAFSDHRRGEIADILAVEPGEEAPIIHLLHCKAMASVSKKPGVSLKNAHVVLSQARKCLRWLHNPNLFTEIRERASEESIILGTIHDFDAIIQQFTPQTVKYAVHIVQPGFSIEKIKEWDDESLRLMLLSLYDELHNQDVEFFVVGSE